MKRIIQHVTAACKTVLLMVVVGPCLLAVVAVMGAMWFVNECRVACWSGLCKPSSKSRRKELDEQQKQALVQARLQQVLQCVRSLNITPIAHLHSLHPYDDPDIAPYYKGKSRFFNEHYLSAVLNEEQLAAKIRYGLVAEQVVAEKRTDHLLLVYGRLTDFYELSLYRTGEHDFVVVEWWHHDYDASSGYRSSVYRDDFQWLSS